MTNWRGMAGHCDTALAQPGDWLACQEPYSCVRIGSVGVGGRRAIR